MDAVHCRRLRWDDILGWNGCSGRGCMRRLGLCHHLSLSLSNRLCLRLSLCSSCGGVVRPSATSMVPTTSQCSRGSLQLAR